MFRKLTVTALIAACVVVIGIGGAAAQEVSPHSPNSGIESNTSFTYQGQLKNNGSPVNDPCDFQFSLWDSMSGGLQISGTTTQTVLSVSVSNGLFTTPIDFGISAFDGGARYLQIAVGCPSPAATFTPMTSRQVLTPVPYALHAADAWSNKGDNGTDPTTNFLGTTDNVTLTFRVSDTVAYRIVPAYDPLTPSFAPNIIGGSGANSVAPGLYGATIGGGGGTGIANRVNNLGTYATIGGGFRNTAGGFASTTGGGGINTASGNGATIGGGENNTADGGLAIIGGGGNNTAGDDASVSGGYSNTASGNGAFVGGGYFNTASGGWSTVPGGFSNSATMDYAFAAGNRAQANHQGTFVWADSTNAPFASTGNDQFLIRANGGVGIGTSSPRSALDILGPANDPLSGLPASENGLLLGLSLNTYKWIQSYGGVLALNPRGNNVGIGTSSPNDKLEVNGILRVDSLGSAGGTNLCLNGSNQLASCSSSERYKNNISDLALGLDTLAKLRPVTFNWKDSGQADLGFVAEEVNQVTPLLTTLNQDGQIEGVKYDRITAVLVKGMQEQQQQIADLKAQNAALKQQHDAFESRLAALEQLAQSNNPVRPDNTGSLALMVIAGLLGIIVVRKPWRRGER